MGRLTSAYALEVQEIRLINILKILFILYLILGNVSDTLTTSKLN